MISTRRAARQDAPSAGATERRRSDDRRTPFTQIPDWVMLCERIPPPAFRLWCILRSMQFESGSNLIMPPLTIDEICWLLPGVNGKPTSAARAREALGCLMREGLLRDISEPGLGKGAPRSYLALDEPGEVMPWKDARGKLKRYTKFWRKK